MSPSLRTRPRTVALVQDWFFAPGGSEEVALELAGLLPGAEVHTSFMEAEYRVRLTGHRVHTWPLQRIFGATSRYRNFLPLYPIWFSALDLRGSDLVVSSSSAFAKAARIGPQALHLAYIHTPMRFAWDLDGYLSGSSASAMARIGARAIRPLLRRWDRSTAQHPDVLIANSETTRARIREHWGLDAELIHPPVDTSAIAVSSRDDGFLLVAARMLAYRRLDLAVAAATSLGRDLVVVGDGPEDARLRDAAGPTVRFLGRVDRATLIDLFRRCHAYLAPGVEDFGMAPVEAMAAGKPVVGFRRGGVAETVIDGVTGALFDKANVSSMAEAIERADTIEFDPAAIRRRAEEFDSSIFRRRWRDLFMRLGVDPSLYSGG